MLVYLVSSGLDDFVERVQDVEVQEREEAVLQVEVSTEKATVTWHKVTSVVVLAPNHIENPIVYDSITITFEIYLIMITITL